MTVEELMFKNPITLPPTMSVADAAKTMLDNQVSAIPIVDGKNKLLGVVSSSDYMGSFKNIPHAVMPVKTLFGENFDGNTVSHLVNKVNKKKLSSVMKKNFKTVNVNMTPTDVMNVMLVNDLEEIPVVDGEKLLGMISRQNILKIFTLH